MSLKRGLLGLCLLAALAPPVAAQTAGAPAGVALSYSDAMFDRQAEVTGKVPLALRARTSGALPVGALTLGGRFSATVISERTNRAGKFPILSRLPDSHAAGRSDSYGVVNEAALAATLAVPWLTAYAQGIYTEVEYPGQEPVQLRKVWAAIGDLERAPVYLAVGRKTVNFGLFETYAPFTHSHSAHYFWPQSNRAVAELGYVGARTDVALTLIPAHRGLRVLSTPANDNRMTNFAVNAAHRIDLGAAQSLRLGAGYLRGTIYDSAIAHHPPGRGANRVWNGAWDIHATWSGPGFDVQAEFTRTLRDWPATGHHVQATTVQGRLHRELFGRPAVYSLSASRGVQGPDGSAWERMEQVILGLEVAATPNLTLGAEYIYNAGFVPLILPKLSADRAVESHSLILGATMTF